MSTQPYFERTLRKDEAKSKDELRLEKLLVTKWCEDF